jgi:hypothetical protein
VSDVTVEQIMKSVAWSNEATEILKAVQQQATERATRYGIHDVYRYNDKMGICWLVEGGPKNQVYRSETAILRKYAENIVYALNHEGEPRQQIEDAEAAELRVAERAAKRAERKERKRQEKIAKGLPV